MFINVSNELILWYLNNKRDLPWRNTHDPYHVWVSEIILQQTRVAQGLSYYVRFIESFPTVTDLAQAPQEQVLKLWQGLGYYSRARNMHTAAKQIVAKYNGKFPDTYKELLNLKGVGEYTAAAVASLAFNEPVAVVDGNVIRVVSRLFGIEQPVDKPSTLKEIKLLAASLLNKEKPALHNQAIMEFGALHCVPANPACNTCVTNSKCLALKYNLTALIPAKGQKIKVKDRFFYYLIIQSDKGIYFQQRGAGDIWEGLFEFPLMEAKATLPAPEMLKMLQDTLNSANIEILSISPEIKHILTHQKLYVTFIHLKSGNLGTLNKGWKLIDAQNIHDLAVPRVIDKHIRSQGFIKIMENIL